MENSLFKLVTLVFCLALLVSVSFADSGKKTSPSKATKVEEKLKESGEKEQTKPNMNVITPIHLSPKHDQPAVHNKPIESQQMQVLSASAVDDKGKQIKWQVVSSGAVQGGTSVTYQLGRVPGYVLSGTVGQLAVGPGSSESYGMNSGYWQEELGGGYLRGDANLDGVIDIADASYLINYLFIGGPAPDPFWVGDANCDDVVDIGDASYIINYLFIGGPPPGC